MNKGFFSRVVLFIGGISLLTSCSHDLSKVGDAYQESPLYTAVRELPEGMTPAVIQVHDVASMKARFLAAGYVQVGSICVDRASAFSLSEVGEYAQKYQTCVVLTNLYAQERWARSSDGRICYIFLSPKA